MKIKEFKKKPELIIYDWDNTLADTANVITNVINRLRADAGKGPLGRDEILNASGDPDCQWINEFFGASCDENAKKYVKYYDEENKIFETKLLPHALDMIKYVSEIGIPQAVLTNKESAVAHKECTDVGVRDHFFKFVGKYDTPNKKPAIDGILHIIEHFKQKHGKNLEIDEVWFIGDTMVDVACAGNFGCPMIFVGLEEWIRPKYKDFIYATGNMKTAREILISTL